jgi:hypothetical protein
MKTIEIISQDLFDKIRSRFTNLQMGDEAGAVTMDPRQARFYDFDFAIESHNLGRVSISINELGTLKVFYGQSILEDIDPVSREYWYDFLREMRNFAKRRLLRFDTRDITKSNLDKDDFQYLATNGSKEDDMNIKESVKFNGTKKTSYGKLQTAKVIVKHNKPIEDESFGARKRPGNIKAIYVQNEEGERFKYPFIHTAGAIAMAQHVAHGGKPYDELGNAIVGLSEKISNLASCTKHMSLHDGMNQEAHQIAERVGMKLQELRGQVKMLGGRNGYESWAESFVPMSQDEELDAATMEDYKSKFTQKSFREDLTQYFPLIHAIMKETGELNLEDLVGEASEEKCDECGYVMEKCACDTVKEDVFSRFESWANSLAEGTIEPDTLAALGELLGQNITIGADATNAIEALQGIGINDEGLEELLAAKAKIDPEMTLSDGISEWLTKVDPEAAQELLGQTQEPAPQQQPEPTQAAEQPPESPAQMDAPSQEPEMAENTDHLRNPDTPAIDRKKAGYQLTPKDVDVSQNKHKWDYHQRAHGQKHPEDPREGEAGEDYVDGEQEEMRQPNMRELAQWLQGHYNAAWKEEGFKSPWRKGARELGLMAEKEFGPEYSHLVKELMGVKGGETPLNRVVRKAHERAAETEEADNNYGGQLSPVHGEADDHEGTGGFAESEFTSILRLAGLAK